MNENNNKYLYMMKSKQYQAPRVLQQVGVRLERSFLKASLVDTALVYSVGQEVEEYNFSDTNTEFNHTWGE